MDIPEISVLSLILTQKILLISTVDEKIDVLFIVAVTTQCTCDEWDVIEALAHARKDWLKVLSRPATVNFHPDRFSNNGKTITENLLEQGQYHGQFRTGITNGGKSAFIGGNRFLWEQRIFFDAYPLESVDRPKYGALNLFSI